MPGKLDTLLRVWLWVVFAYFAWTAYLIGWTDFYAAGGDEFAVGSWAARTRYAGTGLNAVLHLNLSGIAQAVGPLIFLVFVTAVLWPGRRIVNDRFDLFALVAILTGLSLYTFVLIDKPTNYYHSRYYLPVIVPLMFLYAVKSLRGAPGWLFAAITVGTIAISLPFAYQLVSKPPFQNRYDLIEHAESVIPRNAAVLAWGNKGRPFHLMWANVIKYHTGSDYLFIGEDDAKALGWIEQFRCVAEQRPVYVISDRRVDHYLGVAPTREFVHEDRHYPARIPYYPLKPAGMKYQFFYYRIDAGDYPLPVRGAPGPGRESGASAADQRFDCTRSVR